MTLTTKIADPYASALLDLAVSTHTVDLVTADINELLEIFNTNKELVDYLTNPLYSISSKKAVLKKVIEPNFFNQNTTRFMMVLTERSRIGLFQAIAEKYLKLVYDLAEIKIAQVTSAFELTANQETEIVEQLRVRTGAKEIKMVTAVDKSLLGGLQIQIGSNVIDVSLKGQLRQLAAQLETTLF
jgi:F-type H+-transporting ATPase subunit delta|tara:strand:- start:2311 stop:2865 length:555 start_codon:yes stop_codon:yes gene_type:complete